MNRKRSAARGVLLMEALISLFILGLALAACWDALSASGGWIKKNGQRVKLAEELEVMWMENILNRSLGPLENPAAAWSVSRHPFEGGLEKTVFQARWIENGTACEDTFEALRSIR